MTCRLKLSSAEELIRQNYSAYPALENVLFLLVGSRVARKSSFPEIGRRLLTLHYTGNNLHDSTARW
jgi:hypothetical protein